MQKPFKMNSALSGIRQSGAVNMNELGKSQTTE